MAVSRSAIAQPRHPTVANGVGGGLTALLVGLIQNSRAANSISGKKAYIISALTILTGIYVLFTGEAPTYGNPVAVPPSAGLEMILTGLGLSTLRAGVSKSGNGNGTGSG